MLVLIYHSNALFKTLHSLVLHIVRQINHRNTYAAENVIILHFIAILLRCYRIVSIMLTKHLTFIMLDSVHIRKTDLQKQFE